MGLQLIVHWLDIPDPSFHYENQLGMWRPDPTIGFVNQRDFTRHAWGNILVHTDEHGLRGSSSPAFERKEGVRRIIGVGDSVMWGTGVNQEDSFLGILERKLNAHSMHEVMNGGVVGYSTYQELLYLEEYALSLKPDIVLINYCDNDLLPSEDPFGNVREVYLRYLDELMNSNDRVSTPEVRARVGDLIRIFTTAASVWNGIDAWKKEAPDRSKLVREAFIEIPMTRMAQLSRAAGVRLIYVLIPPQLPFARYLSEVDELKKFLPEHGIEFIDMQPALESDSSGWGGQKRARQLVFDWMWRGDLRQLLLLWRIESIHRKQNFLDGTHPTRRGNEIIAEQIYQYLQTR
jgi:lysophospholipase L1-like esterase